jgi:hypothetical protein
MMLSKVSHVLPPVQRVNSRFMNLVGIFNWGYKVLHFLKQNNNKHSDEYDVLTWVINYKELIIELFEVNFIVMHRCIYTWS